MYVPFLLAFPLVENLILFRPSYSALPDCFRRPRQPAQQQGSQAGCAGAKYSSTLEMLTHKHTYKCPCWIWDEKKNTYIYTYMRRGCGSRLFPPSHQPNFSEIFKAGCLQSLREKQYLVSLQFFLLLSAICLQKEAALGQHLLPRCGHPGRLPCSILEPSGYSNWTLGNPEIKPTFQKLGEAVIPIRNHPVGEKRQSLRWLSLPSPVCSRSWRRARAFSIET